MEWGMKNGLLGPINVSFYLGNDTICRNSYNGRQMNSYAICRMIPFPIILNDLGWLSIFF